MGAAGHDSSQKRSSGIFGSSTSINSTALEPVHRKGNASLELIYVQR